MKNLLRRIPIYRRVDDWTNTPIGITTVIVTCLIAIALIWYWRTLK